jgi:hypothetical protein
MPFVLTLTESDTAVDTDDEMLELQYKVFSWQLTKRNSSLFHT